MSTRCPSCFVALSDQQQPVFVCEGGCAERDDPVATKYRGQATRLKRLSEAPPGTTLVACQECRRDTSTQVCPRCHAVLPPAWRKARTTCIAMAGPRVSGKSFYIAVMKRQLEQLFAQQGLRMTYETEQTRAVYEQLYEGPVYVQRGILESTRPARVNPQEREPLIFAAGMAGGRPHHLVIRDVAGEDLEQGLREPFIFDFFADADTILFLFDPLKVEQVRQMLAGLVPMPDQLGVDPQVVLDHLLRRVQPSNRADPVPIGLVLAKFDVLQQLSHVEGTEWTQIMQNQGAAFMRDPSMNALSYNDVDGRLLHTEVRSLLHKLGADALVRRVESVAPPPSSRYFAVSSLGQPAMQDALHPHGISPFRCVDPVKWALARSGVLPVLTG